MRKNCPTVRKYRSVIIRRHITGETVIASEQYANGPAARTPRSPADCSTAALTNGWPGTPRFTSGLPPGIPRPKKLGPPLMPRPPPGAPSPKCPPLRHHHDHRRFCRASHCPLVTLSWFLFDRPRSDYHRSRVYEMDHKLFSLDLIIYYIWFMYARI